MKYFFYLLTLSVIITACSSDKEQITECYHTYQGAIIDNDVETAVKTLSEGSLEKYEYWANLTLTASADKVSKLNNMDKFMVLLLRSKHKTKPFTATTGAECFAYTIDNNLIDKSLVKGKTIEDIVIEGYEARVDINNQEGKFLLFTNEDGDWKVDMKTLVEVTTTEFNKMEIPDNEFLQMLKVQYGENISPDIWEPIK